MSEILVTSPWLAIIIAILDIDKHSITIKKSKVQMNEALESCMKEIQESLIEPELSSDSYYKSQDVSAYRTRASLDRKLQRLKFKSGKRK